MLEQCVVGKCCREVLGGVLQETVGEESCRGVLLKRIEKECWRRVS